MGFEYGGYLIFTQSKETYVSGSVNVPYNKEEIFGKEVFCLKRISPILKYAAQFGYEHKNMGNHFSGVKKHADELSKLLDGMFPKEKKKEEKKDGE